MPQVKVLNQSQGNDWILYHGDSVEVLKGIPDDSLHFSVFSPPFASIYTYSNSERDMGNSKTDDDFSAHFGFLVKELYRCMMPGRLIAMHCMNIPAMKSRDGYIGVKDFRGDLIRWFQAEGFIYHSEVCIWKDPVIQMQRTKSIGLLHKQVCKDSAMSRQGLPDYLVVMRKPGDNPEPVSGELNGYVGTKKLPQSGVESINIWQNYASPCWLDIDPNDTLQYQSARDNNDERHICPLQLGVIRRALQLWTNPGDVVLDPFNGIGSSGHVALQMNRKYVGIELKESYYKCAVNNLHNAENSRQGQLALI
jgi:DNA modification methylase